MAELKTFSPVYPLDYQQYMAIDIATEEGNLSWVSGDIIKYVEDFNYLSLFLAESRRDLNTRKGMGWSACIIKVQKV